ncbi:MAG: hypothetical protein JWO79_2763 [Actinomycetia bacterium]|nr:hypothetical protein [Actinomycetes bacterium]
MPAVPRTSRRGLLAAAAGVVAGAAAGTTVAGTRASAAAGTDPLLHLLRRASYGPTAESEAEIRSLGAHAWLDRQLSPGTIDDSACATVLKRYPLIYASVPTIRRRVSSGLMKAHGWDAMMQVAHAAIVRAAWSERQLFEVMTDFWSNHLNVANPSDGTWDNRQDYDLHVIRPHTFGRFADMLKASARHPAMLNYLDNRSSTKTHPNENYARELLELHTVGLVYSEADVKNAARLLTGLTTTNGGVYAYDGRRHATGAVRVLTFTHANRTAAGGQAASLNLLDYLAMHPATARQIARKLCLRFVSDDPPPALVQKLAAVYLTSKTAIVPVLRALFGSAEFAASEGQKVRRPFEDLVATIRVLGIGPEQVTTDNPAGTKGVQALFWILQGSGHAPLNWAPPNGYPDVAAAWASSNGYLSRWNSHMQLAGNWYPKQLTRPASLLDHLVPAIPTTFGGLVDALTTRITGSVFSDEHRSALTGFFGKTPSSSLARNHAALNWKFPYLVALVLSSPEFMVR